MGTKGYHPKEEFWNIVTHGFGLILSLFALVFLINRAGSYHNVWYIVSFSIYGATLVILYLASTLYHASRKISIRKKLNVFDHASIYLLIAGTYTPFLLITLRDSWGCPLLIVVWGLAVIGVLLKLFFTGRYDKISTLFYILMGWIIVIVIKPLISAFPSEGIFWLVTGGISYSIGAVFYLLNKLSYNHVIFHVLVLVGSCTHFVAVFFYV